MLAMGGIVGAGVLANPSEVADRVHTPLMTPRNSAIALAIMFTGIPVYWCWRRFNPIHP